MVRRDIFICPCHRHKKGRTQENIFSFSSISLTISPFFFFFLVGLGFKPNVSHWKSRFSNLSYTCCPFSI
jgi:hypothetical protein